MVYELPSPALPEGRILGQLLPIEVTNDSRDVGPRLVIRRHAAILLHAMRSGVVSGKGLRHIEIVFLQQFAQVFCSGLNVSVGIE